MIILLYTCYLSYTTTKNKIFYCFTLSLQVSYFDILVPTIDTVRYGFLLEKLLDVNHSVLYTGTTGVGKVSFCAVSVVRLLMSLIHPAVSDS